MLGIEFQLGVRGKFTRFELISVSRLNSLWDMVLSYLTIDVRSSSKRGELDDIYRLSHFYHTAPCLRA